MGMKMALFKGGSAGRKIILARNHGPEAGMER